MKLPVCEKPKAHEHYSNGCAMGRGEDGGIGGIGGVTGPSLTDLSQLPCRCARGELFGG